MNAAQAWLIVLVVLALSLTGAVAFTQWQQDQAREQRIQRMYFDMVG